MTLKERADALARTPIFAGLSRRSIEQIASVYDFKNPKPKGTDIFDASFLPPTGERKVN